ncbi:dihydrolipoamide acetyltransferase family protein [Streptomyces chromofuscus]|uniref:Dihydrolipoamide acetyltransferase component of pyruvate dehydrogenase complex n=1 Tax=Streptomyces chromofuscus TaxID=42881 RepID=A0A7M2T0R2_STRCW|nr:dihydrolipoamide acetyltransferase family protein [Streptomyces chromofuscus]QOV41924.1 2-oxo acid dehydrogenase subunit E2 [Streptomyces chromofuscus]GGS87204.1 dihydrolipoamide acetyltransferase component of pyruvate dehydrogenase complex [Streptomyces chromofuscus]
MAQVLEFKLPDLGEGLTEAEIVRWLVQVGDVVAVDQPVVEVETAKAMVEVPCPYGGVVTARFGEEGTELPVGAPLLTVAVGAPGDAGAGTDAGSGPARSVAAEPGPGSAQGTGLGSGAADGTAVSSVNGSGTRTGGGSDTASGNVLVGYGTGAPPARRRRVRPQAPTVPPRASTTAQARAATSPASPGSPLDTRANGDAARGEGPVPVISPLVRRLARENGLDLRELTGSGPDGLILRADVEYALRAAAAQGRSAQPRTEAPAHMAAPVQAGPHARVAPAADGVTAPPAPAPAPVTSAPAHGVRVPLKGVRGAVADKLSRSRREIPDATCWVDADATELMRARTAMNAAGGPKISLLALLARICTAALTRFPELNSTVDMAAREIVRLDRVHLGFAAQTERGLVVPVVRDAQARDAEGLTAEFARLTEAARAGTLTPAELTGGTFTLNNYGVFGVDGSTPIINHPEAAMLGVGRIVPKPWVHEGELAVRQVVQLSLTFDHRVCDGGTAGGFLRYVADCVEQPAVLLRTL